ncbi:piggybac transposable element-derived protein 4 [Holotrichia oblita]|uniref:Piggybac transposable element-derived protein 4 n=1 Tax=Holotrichia oblita TaxID=644536 RepID=A0ACB9SQJ1_HOLOL|nr:piggybac transposable element-derived protein 4 [Holotrichia oblita]
MWSYEKEQEHLNRLWNELDNENSVDDPPIIDSEDEHFSDHEAESSHETDTEQSGNEVEEESDEENHDNEYATFYVSKDNSTKWAKTCANRTVRTRAENIITFLPGVKSRAKNLKTPLDCWRFFIDEVIITDIVKHTNNKIKLIQLRYSACHQYLVSETDIEEIEAVFGLLYLAGVYHSSRTNLEELWAGDDTGIPIFRKTMSLQRFRLLLQCLRFDELSTRQTKEREDGVEEEGADRKGAVRKGVDGEEADREEAVKEEVDGEEAIKEEVDGEEADKEGEDGEEDVEEEDGAGEGGENGRKRHS